jgi:hypothetical protein
MSTPQSQIGGAEVQCHSSFTSVLERGEWLTSHLGRFSPENEHRYPLNARLGGPQSRSGRFGEEKSILPGPPLERQTARPVA